MTNRVVEHKIKLDGWTRLGLFLLAIGVLANAAAEMPYVRSALAQGKYEVSLTLSNDRFYDGSNRPFEIELKE